MKSAAQARSGPGSLRVLLALGYALLLMGLVAFSMEGYRELERQRARERELEARVRAAEARIRQARASIDRMQRDPLALERLAREHLGWVRPGEVVLILAPSPELGQVASRSRAE